MFVCSKSGHIKSMLHSSQPPVLHTLINGQYRVPCGGIFLPPFSTGIQFISALNRRFKIITSLIALPVISRHIYRMMWKSRRLRVMISISTKKDG